VQNHEKGWDLLTTTCKTNEQKPHFMRTSTPRKKHACTRTHHPTLHANSHHAHEYAAKKIRAHTHTPPNSPCQLHHFCCTYCTRTHARANITHLEHVRGLSLSLRQHLEPKHPPQSWKQTCVLQFLHQFFWHVTRMLLHVSNYKNRDLRATLTLCLPLLLPCSHSQFRGRTLLFFWASLSAENSNVRVLQWHQQLHRERGRLNVSVSCLPQDGNLGLRGLCGLIMGAARFSHIVTKEK
jgi:hypothetical protein